RMPPAPVPPRQETKRGTAPLPATKRGTGAVGGWGLGGHGRGRDERPVLDSLQQIRLLGLQLYQQRQHVYHVEQLACVFGQPVVGLDQPERRGRAAVADDRAAAVLLAVAEPLG